MQTRRSFLTGCAAVAASSLVQADPVSAQKNNNPVCVFTKPFNSLSFDELAQQVAAIGLQGIEAPVRAGGHIEPEAVPDELPKLVEALAAHGREVTILTSDVNDPSSPLTEKVLRTAAELGIRYYRMKYLKYDESRSITAQIRSWKGQLRDLAALNQQLGITAVYQNHAGRNYFGAPIWDLASALDGIDPTHLGVAYDIRHATVEAGMSWPIGFHRIRPHVQVVYVKDFVWGDRKPVNVPLGQGRVQKEFFSMLRQSGFAGPVSLHEEYLDHRRPELVPDHWKAIAQDYQTLRSWMSAE